MIKQTGFQTFYWDDKEGKIWLEIDKWDQEFIYINSLSQGIGSNDIGLDRGQIGGSRIVKFQRYGPKVLLVEPNYGAGVFPQPCNFSANLPQKKLHPTSLLRLLPRLR